MKRGEPESPVHVSRPPSPPAQSMIVGRKLPPYTSEQCEELSSGSAVTSSSSGYVSQSASSGELRPQPATVTTLLIMLVSSELPPYSRGRLLKHAADNGSASRTSAMSEVMLLVGS